MNKPDLRYSDSLEEDRLFYASTPHLSEFQKTVAMILWGYLDKSSVRQPNVLELGCGTGITAHSILSANPGLVLRALDNEKDILDQAHERLREYEEKGRLKFQLGDIYEYLKTLSGNSLEAIVSAFTLHNCTAEYRQKTYEEIMRVLKPDGIFINADKYASDDANEHRQALEWQLAQFEYFAQQGRSDLKEKWTKHYVEDEDPNLVLKESEFVKDMEAIGLTSIERVFRKHMEAIYVVKSLTKS